MGNIRKSYGVNITSLGEKNEDIVLLEGDLADSTMSDLFQERFPERHFQIGIAEQNMVGIAAGLALEGKIPFVNSFAAFIAMRACEQVRTDIAYPNLNVKLVVSHAGLSAGSAGPSHHCIEDLGIMRSIPNMAVFCPGDEEEMKQVLEASLEIFGPVYIRMSAMDCENIYVDEKFQIGKATLLKEGTDITLVSTGTLMNEILEASKILQNDHGISSQLLQIASIKPFDKQSIIEAVRKTGKIVTIEEHNIIGGLGSSVAEVVAELGKGKISRIGINDKFTATVGTPEFLMAHENLTVPRIIKETLELLK